MTDKAAISFKESVSGMETFICAECHRQGCFTQSDDDPADWTCKCGHSVVVELPTSPHDDAGAKKEPSLSELSRNPEQAVLRRYGGLNPHAAAKELDELFGAAANSSDAGDWPTLDEIMVVLRRHTHAPGEGWVMVPKEPTPKMREAGASHIRPEYTTNAKEFYQAMLAAAPSPEGE